MARKTFSELIGGATGRRMLLIATALLAWSRPGAAQINSFTSDLYTVAQAARNDKTDDVILLLQQGKRPDTTIGSTGETALGYAAQFGDAKMAQALLYYKAPVDTKDQFGNTPLHWAADRGATDIVQMLVDAKAPIDAQNKQGMTPLMMAAKNGQVQAVRLLLKDGADPHRADFTGRDALGWAAGKPAVQQFLRAAK